MSLRINKFLASCGYGSRRLCDEMISKGQVYINGKKAALGSMVEKTDKIEVLNSEPETKKPRELSAAKPQTKVYYLLNKPKFVLSTVRDRKAGDRKTVMDLIKTDKRIFPVGRLDYESSGLIIMTNDGELMQKITHPSNDIEKVYLVDVDKKVSPDILAKIRKVTQVNELTLRPFKVEAFGSTVPNRLKFILKQGVKREIREICKLCDLKVSNLHRISIGDVTLGKLKSGESKLVKKSDLNF